MPTEFALRRGFVSDGIVRLARDSGTFAWMSVTYKEKLELEMGLAKWANTEGFTIPYLAAVQIIHIRGHGEGLTRVSFRL